MELHRSFTYQFEDMQWPNKLGVGALISLVPILNFAVVGYEVAIVRNVAAGAGEPLPQWDDLGNKWRDGLILTLAGLVYAIPVLIGIGLLVGVLLASGAISQSGRAPDSGPAITAVGVLALACFLVFLAAYSLLLSLIRPVILVLFSREGSFASCFRLREILRIINRLPRPFLTVWVVIIGASLVIGLVVGFINSVLGFIPCLGWIAGAVLAVGTAMYLLTVDGYIFGQFRRVAVGPESQGSGADRTSDGAGNPT